MLQQQLMQLVNERQSLHQRLDEQQGKIANQQLELEQQQQMIIGQAEKLAQQQTIIQEQNTLITAQQKELDKNKQELFWFNGLRYQLKEIKKMMYGIRSEKRHQPTQPGNPVAGDQLVLDMNADTWGVCQITSRRKITEHLRVVTSTTPKKCGGRHDFPSGLEE